MAMDFLKAGILYKIKTGAGAEKLRSATKGDLKMMTIEKIIEMLDRISEDSFYWVYEEFKEIKLTIEDFGGFDENWREKDRDLEDPEGVEGVLNWLELKADSIDDEWCTEYHIGDITVKVDYTSYSI